MHAVWYRFRGELRTRRRSVAGFVLLVGFAAGIALAAAAGARRTETAHERMVARTSAGDVLVNPDLGTDSGLELDAVARLPGVTQVGRADGLFVVGTDPEAGFSVTDDIVLASDGKLFFTFGRPKILDGRMPDPGRASEVLVSQQAADQHHVGVGDRLPVAVLSTDDVARVDSGELDVRDAMALIMNGQLGERTTLRVVGVGVTAEDVVLDEGFENGTVYLTPAFLRAHPRAEIPYFAIAVRLRDGGTGIPAFREAVEALPHVGAIAFQTGPVTAAKVDRAVRPFVAVLSIFAIVVAVTGMLIVGQTFARQSFLDSLDSPSLHALGFSRAQLFSTAMLRAGLIAVGGSLLAVAGAIALSPLTPIGPARLAEPDPGLRLDPLVLTVGGLAVFAGVLALAALPAWRNARTRSLLSRDDETARPSVIARAFAGAGASVPAAAGVRMALEPGRGRTAVPVRTTVVSAALAIATVMGAVVFAASLDHLVSTPRLYGWNWDVFVSLDTDFANAAAQQQVADALDESPGVAGWAAASLSDLVVDGKSVPTVGIDRGRGGLAPTLVDGRIPRAVGEIALAARTLRSLGRGVGDTVVVQSPEGDTARFKIVGRVVLPGTGTYPGSDKTALGEGAVVTGSALRRFGPAFDQKPFLVEFRPDANRAEVMASVRNSVTAIDPDGVFVQSVQRPSDIVEYGNVRTTPLVLAGVLALLAAATVTHALVSAVRRRRRDLALLKTLGFSRRQVSATVAWQATAVGLLALLFGIPLGIVVGRVGWRALTDNLGTVSEPVVPFFGVLLAIPAVLLLVNLVAYVPGRVAARLRPAVVLRSE